MRLGNNIIGWNGMLQHVVPQAGRDHDWLCEVTRKDGQKAVQVLTTKQYETQKGCRKLRLHEIITISQEQCYIKTEYKHMRFRCSYDVSSKFEVFVNGGVGAFSVDAAQQIKNKVITSNAETRAFSEMHKAVQEIYKHARQKHTQVKTQGIWAKVKAFIWSFVWTAFFDQKKQIDQLRKDIPPAVRINASSVPNYLRDRIRTNIFFFETHERKEGIQNNPQLSGKDKDSMIGDLYRVEGERIDSAIHQPKDVKQWAKSFHSDRFKMEEGGAHDTYFKRILTLNKIWEDFIEIQREATSSAPEPQASSAGLVFMLEAPKGIT